MPPPAVVGRTAELAVLRDALRDVGAGTGRVVVLSGEAGIGKSRLVDDVMVRAGTGGMVTMLGRADEVATDLPFAAFVDAVEQAGTDPLVAPLVRAVTPGELSLADRSLAVADAVSEMVEAAATTGSSTVLAVEDLHWADAATLTVVNRLVRRAPSLPVLLLLTIRSGAWGRNLEVVVEQAVSSGALDVTLTPLDEEEVERLATEVVGLPPGPTLRDQLGGCTGNPLYIIESLRALDDAAVIGRAAGRADLTGGAALPASLRATLIHRLGFLAPTTLRPLQLAALLGRSFTVEDLAAITGTGPIDLVDPLGEARRAALIDTDPGTGQWRFRHDLIRHALIDDLPAPLRRSLHHHAARALEAAGAPITSVARQYGLGAEPGDRAAINALRAAAAEAFRSSATVGVALLEQALALTPRDDAERCAILVDLIDPLAAGGRMAEAHRRATEALGLALTSEQEVQVRWARTGLGVEGADESAALAEIEGLLARDDLTSDLRANLHAMSTMSRLILLDIDGMAEQSALAVRSAAGSDDDRVLGFADSAVAWTHLARGETAAAERAAAAAHRRWVSGHRWGRYHPPFALSLVALENDDLDGAARILRTERVECEHTGAMSWLAQLTAVAPLVPLVAGDLDGATAECHAARLLDSEMTTPGYGFPAGLPASMLSIIAWHRGDRTGADAYATEAETHYARRGPEIGIDLAWLARALALEEAGDDRAAFDLLNTAWALTAPVRYLVTWRLLGPELARLAVRHAPEVADQVAGDLAEGTRRNPTTSARAAAALCRGLASGDLDRQLDAVELYRAGPRRLETARAEGLAAAALRAAGRATEARALADRALATYRELGADGSAARLRRALGRRTRSRSGSPTFGWDSLTATERLVVDLLQEGLTNREIGDRLGISRRTVETHLSHTFTKVGVTTRVQLAVAANSGGVG